MSRNPRLLASRPLDRAWRPIAQFTAMERLAAVVAAGIVAALLAGAVGADHYDSARRMANVQAALTARGLGSAHVERLWRGPYRCKHGYLWRTASARGSACTDSFSSSVAIYGPGEPALAEPPRGPR